MIYICLGFAVLKTLDAWVRKCFGNALLENCTFVCLCVGVREVSKQRCVFIILQVMKFCVKFAVTKAGSVFGCVGPHVFHLCTNLKSHFVQHASSMTLLYIFLWRTCWLSVHSSMFSLCEWWVSVTNHIFIMLGELESFIHRVVGQCHTFSASCIWFAERYLIESE